MLIILVIGVHCGVVLSNYSNDMNLFDSVLLAKRLSYFYLDRTVSYNEIMMYQRASILTRNYNLQIVRLEEYPYYLNNFELNIQSINFDSNSKYQILGFSVATFLLL